MENAEDLAEQSEVLFQIILVLSEDSPPTKTNSKFAILDDLCLIEAS